jgi:hypothetical protein
MLRLSSSSVILHELMIPEAWSGKSGFRYSLERRALNQQIRRNKGA